MELLQQLNEFAEEKEPLKHAFVIDRGQDEQLESPYYVIVQAENGKTYRKGFSGGANAHRMVDNLLKRGEFTPARYEESSRDGFTAY